MRQIAVYRVQGGKESVDLLFGHVAQGVGTDRFGHLGNGGQMRCGGGREMQAVGAPVRQVRSPFDQAGFSQLIDQAGQRDRLNFQQSCQFALAYSFMTRQIYQGSSLSQGQGTALQALFESPAHEARKIGKQETQAFLV